MEIGETHELFECEICNIKLNLTIFDDRNLKDKFYLFCKNCIRDVQVCSKSKCKKLFLLNDTDISNTKKIYTYTNTTQQFYLYEDLKQIIINKYGSIENLQTIIKQKQHEKEKRNNKLINIKLQREKELKDAFMMNKLEYKTYGDCYSYIHYAEPSLEIVIQNELKKINMKNTKRMSLASELNKLGIPLDENLKSCYEYINGLSSTELIDVVRCIEIEHFLKHNTNYIELCKIHGQHKAQEIAIRQYAEKQKLPKNIGKSYNKIKLEFH